jgi:hypothetical protein
VGFDGEITLEKTVNYNLGSVKRTEKQKEVVILGRDFKKNNLALIYLENLEENKNGNLTNTKMEKYESGFDMNTIDSAL